MCCVIPPASPPATLVRRMESSRVVLPWSTWPMMVTTGGRGTVSAAAPSSPVAASETSLAACSSKLITLVSAPKKRDISYAVFCLKKKNDGDRVLAVVRGSAINHDGPSSGLTVPHGASQEITIQMALSNSKLASAYVSYVEAHVTGTELGDPIEIHSLAAAYGRSRGAGSPLLVGSVKTNIGHLESAAGVAGL